MGLDHHIFTRIFKRKLFLFILSDQQEVCNNTNVVYISIVDSDSRLCCSQLQTKAGILESTGTRALASEGFLEKGS